MAARALQRFGGILPDVDPGDDSGDRSDDDKDSSLDARVLAGDPERFYATLDQLLAAAPFGPDPDPSTVSPASRVVEACRHLDS